MIDNSFDVPPLKINNKLSSNTNRDKISFSRECHYLDVYPLLQC